MEISGYETKARVLGSGVAPWSRLPTLPLNYACLTFLLALTGIQAYASWGSNHVHVTPRQFSPMPEHAILRAWMAAGDRPNRYLLDMPEDLKQHFVDALKQAYPECAIRGEFTGMFSFDQFASTAGLGAARCKQFPSTHEIITWIAASGWNFVSVSGGGAGQVPTLNQAGIIMETYVFQKAAGGAPPAAPSRSLYAMPLQPMPVPEHAILRSWMRVGSPPHEYLLDTPEDLRQHVMGAIGREYPGCEFMPAPAGGALNLEKFYKRSGFGRCQRSPSTREILTWVASGGWGLVAVSGGGAEVPQTQNRLGTAMETYIFQRVRAGPDGASAAPA